MYQICHQMSVSTSFGLREFPFGDLLNNIAQIAMSKNNDMVESLDCHFNWKLKTDENPQELNARIDSLTNDIAMNPDIEFEALTYQAFLLYYKLEPNNAIEILKIVIEKCKKLEHQAHAEGFLYIAFANLAWMYDTANDETMCNQLMAKIEILKPLSDGARAVVYGTRGYALSSNSRDSFPEALKFCKRAYALEKNYFYRPLAVAILAGRLRRIADGGFSYPTQLEEDTLRKSIDLSEEMKALPFVFLADVTFVKARANDDIAPNNEFLKEAKKLYEKAFALAPGSSYVLTRIGKFFSVIGDDDLAEKYLKEAFLADPKSSMVLHRLGQFYEFKKRDYEKAKVAHELNQFFVKRDEDFKKALFFYEKAITAQTYSRNLFAELDWSRMKKRIDPEYDRLIYLYNMKAFYKDDNISHDTIDKDIEKQIEYDKKTEERKQEQRNRVRNDGINRNNRYEGRERYRQGSEDRESRSKFSSRSIRDRDWRRDSKKQS